MTSPKISNILLTSLFLVVIEVLAAYHYSKQTIPNTTPTISAVAPSIPTNLTTYTNTKHGYSFIYPKADLIISENLATGSAISPDASSVGVLPVGDTITMSHSAELFQVNDLSPVSVPFTLSSLEELINHPSGPNEPPHQFTLTPIQVNNVSAFELDDGPGSQTMTSYFIRSPDGSLLDIITTKNNSESSAMLGSFLYTNSASVVPAGWMWQANQKSGIQFAYPSSWKLKTNSETATTCGPAVAYDYGSSSCPLYSAQLNPQTYISHQKTKYGNTSNNLLSFGVINGSNRSLTTLYDQFKTEYVSMEGQVSNGTFLLNYHGLLGFFINQKTSSYSENTYVIQISDGTYIEFSNRESDKSYSTSGSVTDSNDFTDYTPIIQKIVSSIQRY